MIGKEKSLELGHTSVICRPQKTTKSPFPDLIKNSAHGFSFILFWKYVFTLDINEKNIFMSKMHILPWRTFLFLKIHI